MPRGAYPASGWECAGTLDSDNISGTIKSNNRHSSTRDHVAASLQFSPELIVHYSRYMDP